MADPGFPVGGGGSPTRVLFGENVCENERIGSRRGACTQHALDLCVSCEGQASNQTGSAESTLPVYACSQNGGIWQ